MSMILDVLVLLTIGISIFVYANRGFIKSVLSLCGCLIAIIAATLTKPMLVPVISAPIEKALEGVADGKLSEIVNAAETATAIANPISFVLLFVIYIIVVRLIAKLLDRFCRLPVFKQANRLLGGLMGVVIGIFYAQILAIFLFTFSDFLLSVQDFISPEAFEGSVVAKWMYEYNIFRLLINLL